MLPKKRLRSELYNIPQKNIQSYKVKWLGTYTLTNFLGYKLFGVRQQEIRYVNNIMASKNSVGNKKKTTLNSHAKKYKESTCKGCIQLRQKSEINV